jgi:hypothetical protein
VSAEPPARGVGQPPARAEPPARGVGAGLCDSCLHQQVVRNTRGSVFSLCRRSREEPERFARYPRLPVVTCQGWQEGGLPEKPDI